MKNLCNRLKPVKLKKITCYSVKIYKQNTIHLIKQYLYDIKGLQSDQSTAIM